MDKRKAYLNKYATKICKKIGVKPEDNVFEDTVFSKEGLKFPYKHLVLNAFMANWDPVYNADALDIITHKSKFIKFFETTNLSSGAPPDSLIVNYLNLAKKYFKHGLFISNISHASYIEDKIKSVSNQNSPIIIYGNPGVFKYPVAKIIHHSNKRSKAPFEAVDCSHYNDNQLSSVVFGTVNANSHNDSRGKIASADKGTLYIKNLQDSGRYFQGKLYKLINESIYSKEGSSEFEKSNVRIICSRELRSEDHNDYRPQINTNLYYTLFAYHIYMPSFFFERSDIPLLLYLSFERAKLKYGVQKDVNEIEIPYYLIQYWLAEEKWEDNFLQIQYSCDYYLKEYLKYHNRTDKNFELATYRNKITHAIDKGLYYFYYGKQEDKHRKMLDFYNMFDSTEVVSYLNSSHIDPFYTIKHSDLLYYPFLSFALVSYRTDVLKPEIEYSAYQNLSPFQKDYYFENKWSPRRNLAIKDEEYDPSKQMKSTIVRLKTDKPNIKKIVAEIDRRSNRSNKILAFPINDSKPILIEISPKRKAGMSLLVFLMYERSKSGKRLNLEKSGWDIDWFGNQPDLGFPPFLDICRWFGYEDEHWERKVPGWWFALENARATVTRLSELLESNGISPSIITLKPRLTLFSVYKLHEDVEAEVKLK